MQYKGIKTVKTKEKRLKEAHHEVFCPRSGNGNEIAGKSNLIVKKG